MTDLVSQNIEVILNRKTSMEAVIKIIEENIPEVISLLMMCTLNKVKHYCCGENVPSLHRNVLKLVHSLSLAS